MLTKSKRILSAVLAVFMLLTVLLPMSASAADVTMDLSKCEVSWDYTLTDKEGKTFSAAYGLKKEDNPFGYEIKPLRRSMHDYTAKRPGLTGNKSDWVYGADYVYCFCIEHGIPLPDSASYAGSSNATHGNKYEMLSDDQKDLLHLALSYGYPNRTDLETSKDANACYAATQLIIWQITLGFRSSPTELNDKTYPINGYTGTMTEQYCRNKYFKDYYDRILSDMAIHYRRPSFTSGVPLMAKTYEMDYVNGRYTLSLTDDNHVLNKFYVSAGGGASVKINGDVLTITSSKPINESVTIKLNRRMPSTNHTTGLLIWSVPGKEDENQDMISGTKGESDPVPAYFKVQTAAGNMKIVKNAEDGKVEGIRFHISGNGVDKDVTTGKNGEIQLENLRPGIYTVTEQSYDQYEPQETRRVTVVSGQTATVTFSNTLRRGDLVVTKTSEDGLNEGVKFHLSGTSLSGLPVDEYAVTDSSGTARFEDVLIGPMGDIRSTAVDTSDWTDKAVKNNLDLVRWAQDAADNGWGYVYGTYGTVLDEELLMSKITQYPDEVGSDEAFIRQNWLGKRTADCVGLIKGYGWYDAEKQQTVIDTEKMPDIGADTMYENAAEKGTIDTISEIPGLAVWHEGHIGVYIGDGEVVQAANTRDGVIRSRLEDTAWTHWLKVPYIEYREEPEENK